MFVEFIKHYPMIQFVDFNLKYDNQWGPLIIDYINFVDSCRNIKPVDKSVSVV
jgi:hypothetical protein